MAFDPLSLWNEGEAKEKILYFIRTTTLEGSPNYVLPMDRIAVFDNDGTLWVEQPIYTQLTFALDWQLMGWKGSPKSWPSRIRA
jgi:hypothetical protein